MSQSTITYRCLTCGWTGTLPGHRWESPTDDAYALYCPPCEHDLTLVDRQCL